jgi:hypothetical protein
MPKIRNLVFATIYACQFGFIEKPGFFCPPAAIRNRVFVTIFASRFDLSKKPGFFHPRAQIRNRVFATYLLPSLDLSKKPGFFHPPRKNPVSLTYVQAVRICEIVDLIGKLQMATHPTILNRV